MTVAFAIFLIVHGLIHLLGFAKAFGLAEPPQIHHLVSPLFGILWLIAALLFVASAACLFLWPREFWAIGALAVVVSLIVIAPSWSDAKFGAVADGVACVGVLFAFLANGPFSLRRTYDRDIDRGLQRVPAVGLVADRDLERLPAPVQRYLRASRIVGQPRAWNVHARIHGRFRSGADAGWMPFAAEQYNFFDPPARLFYMTASRFSIPFQAYHRYIASAATMRVRIAALVPVVEGAGDEMTQGETVTMFNDMVALAPHTLIDPAITWRLLGPNTVEGSFSNAGHAIRAVLEFNDAGELLNFSSSDRYQASLDGKTMKRVPWSTPLGGVRSFGNVRLASRGEARWSESDREYSYIQFDVDDVAYNVSSR